MDSQVELRGFGWRYAGRRAWALRGVHLRIEHGERVLLLGPSGSGKSTLLAALAGLLAQDSGEQEGAVLIDGRDARTTRERVGIVFQDPQAQLVMSRAGDDVAFGLENRGVEAAQIWPRVDQALAAVGFGYGRDRSTLALSGGEQQRLVLAGVLALRPSLLLLDEPTANLDPVGARLLRTALGRVHASAETTLVLVEHRVSDSLALVDRVVVLEPGGGVAADGRPDGIFATLGPRLAEQGVWTPGHPPAPRPSLTPAGDVLLRTESATYRHDRGSPPISLMDCEVRASEVLAVVGRNGSGKSTLALLLGGLLRPELGRVVASPALAGPVGPSPHRWRAAALAARIGSVFQDPAHQFVTGRVYDELALGPRRLHHPENQVKSIVDDLLVRLRLERLASANPHTLSGGEQRRLSVATALATAPNVVILDEPTFGQDRRTWQELLDLLAKLRDDGCAVVAMTHDDDFVRALASRTVTLAAVSAASRGTQVTAVPA